MNCLICCDKFKGSLTAQQACAAIERGLRVNNADYRYQLLPMADGGDGSLEIIKQYVEGTIVHAATLDALNRPISTHYYMSIDTAYIELAAASGISRLSPDELSPLHTNTRGTGILINDALVNGANNIVLMLGGSSSTDVGLGIAQELGFRFLDTNGNQVQPHGGCLKQINGIEAPQNRPPFSMKILCDVDNPLHGPHGAAQVFGPQKGATEEDVLLLDEGLIHISQLITSKTGVDIGTISKGGSAGGVAAGLHGLLGAKLHNGFDIISDLSNLRSAIQAADIVITGEGQLDTQSLEGKVVGKVAELCNLYEKPLIGIVGNNTLSMSQTRNANLSEVYSITSRVNDIEDAILNAARYLEDLAQDINLY